MGATPMSEALARPAPSVEQAWVELVQDQVGQSLQELLALPEEMRLDAQWARALGHVRAYAARPAWRGRAGLLLAGYCVARGSATVPARLWRFAAGLELLYLAQALHDEVTGWGLSRPETALAPLLAPGPTGEHLAVVVGDHLFARAMETLVGTSLPGAGAASQYALRLLRASAGGSYRMRQGGALAEQGGVRQALHHARLRMVHGGLASSLVCGAMLAGAEDGLRLRLARVGCGAALSLELGTQLSGLFATPGDFTRGHRTFPLVAAWSRAEPRAREELEALWALPAEHKDEAVLARARELVERSGGGRATQRVMTRSTHGALRALGSLPNPHGLRELLRALVGRMTQVGSPRGVVP